MESNKSLIVFQSKKIRRILFKDEWHYSLIDIVKALTDSVNPTDYLKKLRKRDEELGSYIGTNCPHVEMFHMLKDKHENLGKQIAYKHLAIHNPTIFYSIIQEGIDNGFKIIH